MVYVISQNGRPLMPCSNAIARLLIKQGKAKVKRIEPFTIKLTYETTDYVQNLTLGVDSGSKNIGNSVSTSDGKILYMSEVYTRDDITDKMRRRSGYRSTRRSRKCRYRKKRALNRKRKGIKSKLTPTAYSKLHSHVKEIEFVKKILPINKIVIEIGKFDTNSKTNSWGMCKQKDYSFENKRAKILFRDKYTCQYCKGKSKDEKLEVHHIVFRSRGGSDDEDNLITLCKKCHDKLHHNEISLNTNGTKKKVGVHDTLMNIICAYLQKLYPTAIPTYGYITKINRLCNGIEKQHYYDACMIASGGKQIIVESNLYKKRCVSKGEFQHSTGSHSQKKMPVCKIAGYRRYDKVKYFGKKYFIKGRMSTGKCILMDIDKNKIDFSQQPRGYKIPKMENLTRISARKTWIVDTVKVA